MRGTAPFQRLAAYDVLAVLAERLGGLPQAPYRLSYLHAAPSLGAAALIRAWLDTQGLADRVEWFYLPGGPSPSALPVPEGKGGIVVLEGFDGMPDRATFRQRLEDNVYVVIGTAAPHRWRAEWGAQVFSAHDLVLTAREVEKVAHGRGIELSSRAGADLMEATGGWPVLVDIVLSAYTSGDRLEDLELGLREARPHVRDRVVAGLGPMLRVAAELVAVAGDLTAQELDLLGPDLVQAAAELRALRLSRAELIDGLTCYRLVGLLRDAIRLDLEDHGGARLREIRLRLAQVREQTGLLDCGLEQASLAREWMLCSRILDRWWPQLTFSPYRQLAHRVTFAMPPEAVVAYPGSQYRAEFMGIVPISPLPVPIPTDPDQIRWLCRTEEALLIAKRTAVAMAARRVHHRFQEAREIATQARPLVEASLRAVYSTTTGFGAYWFLHAGISHDLAGDVDEGRRLWRRAWQVREADDLGFCGLDAASKLAQQAAWRGEAQEANRWLEHRVDQVAKPGQWYVPHVMAGFQMAALTVACDALDREESERCHGELHAPVDGAEYWPLALFALVHHQLTWGEAHIALDIVDDAAAVNESFLGGDGIHPDLWHALRADICLALGWGTQAGYALDRIEPQSRFGVVQRARLHLLSGDHEAARSVASAGTRRTSWRRERTELTLIEAVASHELGDEEAARQAMAAGLDQARIHGDLRVLDTIPRQLLERGTQDLPRAEPLLEELDQRAVRPIYPERATLITLTDRERVVLASLAAGRTMGETADQLFVSVNTVKTQVRSLYARLNVHDRRELIEVAGRAGLLDATLPSR